MRNWCAALAVSALLALPLCAQQRSGATDDNVATPFETANSPAPKLAAGDITPAARNLFAMPEAPRPKPLPADAKSADAAPGKLTPRFEAAGMFDYADYHPGSPFTSFNSFGGSGEFVWNPSPWLGLVEQLGGLRFKRNVGGNQSGQNLWGGIGTFMVGPRLNIRRFDYFVPFAEFLVGAATAGPPLTGTQSQSSFAMVAGGGVDIILTRNIAWRFAEIDYLMTNFSGSDLGGNARQDNLRLGTGIVIRWGLPNPVPPPPPHQPPVAACSATPTSIFAGSNDSVGVHVNATSPQNDPLTFSYTASGGSVDGNGPDARWNAGGAGVGTYTVTAKVDDGKGGTASCATDIKVEERPNRPPTASISVDHPTLEPGQKTGVTCTGQDPDGDPLNYTYSATGGQLTGNGQNAQFDSTGLKPGTYTLKCTVNDGRGGTADATADVTVQEPPQVHQLEVRLALHSIYFPTAQPTVARPDGGLLGTQKMTLDALAVDFQQYLKYRPDAHLILGGHADIRGGAEYNMKLSERRVERAKKYLIERGVPADHIDVKAFGEENNMDDAQVKQLITDDPDLSADEKAKFIKNIVVIRLANNRRVDVTLSTTGEQSVRRYPFNTHDALALINPKQEGGAGAKAPAKKTPAPKP
jgi:outer membrane protein OmpA-like peptidoglycan-associated protein